MIELRSLTKRYGDHTVVDHLTFTVRPGSVTGFLGPNGAGKSTTMRMILGLDRPAAGSVLVHGRRYAEHRAPLHEVGALLEPAMHPGRTARDHLRWLADTAGIPRRREDEVMELAGITSVAGRRVGTFSMGMRQRLGVATALLGDPAVVLLDEPVNGLDPDGVLWIRTLTRSLAAEGRTVFISSHLMSEMTLTADHLIVIGRGRLIADLPTEELLNRSGDASVRVRSPRAGELREVLVGPGTDVTSTSPGVLSVRGMSSDAIGETALAAGIAVHELTEQHPSLEEAYMDLTRDARDYRAEPAQVSA